MQTLDTKTICNNNNIILNRNKITEEYAITFKILNGNIRVSSIVTLHLYELLYELNKDIIERFEIINFNENTLNMLLFINKWLGTSLQNICILKPNYGS